MYSKFQNLGRIRRLSFCYALGLAFLFISAAEANEPLSSRFLDRVLEVTVDRNAGRPTHLIVLRSTQDGQAVRIDSAAALEDSDSAGLFPETCLSTNASPCILEGSFSELLKRQLTRTNGYKDFSQLTWFDTEIPNGTVKIEGRSKTEGNELLLSTKGEALLADGKTDVSASWRARRSLGISERKVFFGDATGTPERISAQLESERVKATQDSIYAVSRANDAGASFLVGSSRQHATAFAVSPEGLLITNWHVAGELNCLVTKRCRVRFSQKTTTGEIKEFISEVTLEDGDEQLDYALLKTQDLRQPLIPVYIASNTSAGPNIVSAGFPVDRCAAVKTLTECGSSGVDTCVPELIYSHGVLTSLEPKGYMSSAFSFGGASGGPVFNAADMSLIGFNSSITSGDGRPAPANVVSIDRVFKQTKLKGFLKREAVGAAQ